MKRTRTKILKKLLLLGTLAIFFASVNIAFAGLCDDIESGTGGWISCGEESTSFTEFKGGLEAPDTEGYDEGITRVTTLREYAVNVTNFILGFLGLVGVLMVIYGGFMYLTAAGETDQMDKGKKSIMYAIIGILIVMASFAIVNTVIQAPTGEEKEGVATAEQVAVQRSQRSFEMLANKVKTLAKDLVTAYQNHAEVENELKTILTMINTIEEMPRNVGGGQDDWNGIKKAYDKIGDEFEKIQSRLNQLGDMSKSTLLKSQIAKTEILWREIYNTGEKKGRDKADSNGCKGCNASWDNWDVTDGEFAGGDCICYDHEANDVIDKMDPAVFQIKALLTSLSSWAESAGS